MPNTYDRGDLIRCVATFVASNSLTTDPTNVWFLVQDGGGARATHKYGLTPSAIVKAATGAYYIDLDTPTVGDWAYRWEATGGLQLAEETRFNVRPTFRL